jgi:hypothetical protein
MSVMSKRQECLSVVKPYQLSPMFAAKSRAYPREAPIRCSTLGYASGLTRKYYTKLKRLAMDKHSSLIPTFIKKRLYNIGPGINVIKIFVCHGRSGKLS